MGLSIDEQREEEIKRDNAGYLSNLWKDIKINQKDSKKIYEIVERVIKSSDYNEIIEILSIHSKDPIYASVLKKIRVKFREYQEEMFSEIESMCQDFPEEELYNISKIFREKRDNISWLKEYIEELAQNNNREKAHYLASIKQLTLKNYFEDEYNREYDEYTSIFKVKKELIDEILKETKYKPYELYKKSVEDLKFIKEFEAKNTKERAKERKILKNFIAKFEKTLYDSDNLNFEAIKIDARNELSLELQNELVSHFKASNPKFANKLELALSF